MPVADVAQPLKIADRRQQHAGRSRHRLDDHRRDRLCPMQIDEPLEIVGEFGAMLRKSARKGVACQSVRVAKMIGARQAGAEGAAVADEDWKRVVRGKVESVSGAFGGCGIIKKTDKKTQYK